MSNVAAITGYDPAAPLASLGPALLNPSSSLVPDLSTAAADSSFAFPDLTNAVSASVDLSGVGLGSVPVWGLVAAGLVAVLAVSRR